jgi:hypothetical protein
MSESMNIYCDESCHLATDHQKAMVLGAISAPRHRISEINRDILQIKESFSVGRHSEIKWTGVSPSKLPYYEALIDYYFQEPTMGFRAWIVPDKTVLSHETFDQTHDDWYYKMYFYLLRNLISSENEYRIYIDIKDTRSRNKLQKLHEVLSNAKYDFSRNIIRELKHVHSKEVPVLQLTDLLIGVISYQARGLQTSQAKQALIDRVQRLSGFSLTMNTLPTEQKMNLCFWKPNKWGE